MNATDEWLANLKPGDQVAIHVGMSRNYHLLTVSQRTKLHIILSTGAKYRVASGRAVDAGKWGSSYIEEVTPQVIAAIKRQKLEDAVWSALVKLENVNVVRALSDARLEELLAVLTKHSEEQG